jgi:RNA polymerase sigma-70 factor (ECF subfamily)
MMSLNSMDGRLLSRAKAGDPEAFAMMVEEHREGLFAFLARSTGDEDQAADLLQITLIRAWKGMATYEEKGRYRGWLFTLARRALIDENRRQTRASKVPLRVVGSPTADPVEELVANELESAILDAVHQLPEVRRSVFLMRHHSSMTFREIAEVLEIPLGTALSHMHHALRSLKTVLELHDVSPQ